MFNSVRRVVICMALLSVLVTACGKKDNPKPDSLPAQVTTPVKVKFAVNFPNMTYAGVYGAQKQEFWAAEQLDFEPTYIALIPDIPQEDPIELVLAGEADFGVTRADRLLTARESGESLVAIMTIFQRDPTGFVSLANKNIATPQDLIGKKLLIWDSESAFSLFAVQAGLDLDQVTLISTDGMDFEKAIGMFLTGEVDGTVISATELSVAFSKIGIQHNVLYFYEYGVAMYPNLIFTTEAMIEDHPEVVQHFVNALLRGTQYALENPLEIATWFETTYADVLRPEQIGSQDDVMNAIVPLLNPPSSQIGMMTPETWTFIHDMMVKNGFLQATEVSQAYTLQFLDAYYATSGATKE